MVKNHVLTICEVLSGDCKGRESEQYAGGRQNASVYYAHRRAEKAANKKRDRAGEANKKYVLVRVSLFFHGVLVVFVNAPHVGAPSERPPLRVR